MNCIEVYDSNHSEFEFFQELLKAKNTDACVGNIVSISISAPYHSLLFMGLELAGKKSDYIDITDSEMLDSSHLNLKFCCRHWISLIEDAGSSLAHDDLSMQLLFYLYRVLTVHNHWDYKELVNYLKTYSRITNLTSE